MHKYVSKLFVVMTMILVPAAAAAQEAGKVGVTMGFPQSVGILWHTSENLALRPEFSLSWTSSEDNDTEVDGTSFVTGLSALFYVRKWDNLATYISPRYAFNRASQTFTGPFTDGEASGRLHLLSGSFGAQYWLGDRFSAFGELGLVYTHSTGDDDDESGDGIATRSAVGVVFYF